MSRQPRAVATRAVRVPLVICLGVVVAVAALVPATVAARQPRDLRVGVPTSPDAFELARTAPEAVLAGTTDESCTGWRSTFEPPPTIRVLRTVGPDRDTVQTVPFKDYVTAVMPGEWPAYYPIEAHKAGAMQVKNYGWYFTIVYRGGKLASTGECYDVKDNTADQTYQPQKRTIYPIHRTAVNMTWGQSLRKFLPSKNRSEFFLAEYRTGSSTVCGADADGRRLYQRSILRCARKHLMTYEQILRLYLHARVEIVEPGLHDIIGAEAGDASALVRGPDGSRVPHVVAPAVPDGLQLAGVGGPALAADHFRGARAVDLDRDGRDDLLSLYAPQPGEGDWWRMDLHRSDGTTYGAAAVWAEDASAGLAVDAQLVTADFDGDSRRDVGLVVPEAAATETTPATARLRVWRGLKGGVSAAPVDWWTGPLDLAASRVWAADPNGDGRADLVVAHDLGEHGVEVLVGASLPRGGGLASELAIWHTDAGLRWDAVRFSVGDTNRDHRDDLYLLTPAADGIAIDALVAQRLGGFLRQARWSSSPTDGLSFEGTKLGGADLDYDGTGDLVLFVDRSGQGGGTRLIGLSSRYAGMVAGPAHDDPALDWSATAPY